MPTGGRSDSDRQSICKHQRSNRCRDLHRQRQFITPRNELKWSATEKRPGVFSFGSADRMVHLRAKQHEGLWPYLIWYRVPAGCLISPTQRPFRRR
ncbi:endo-1,4-beta-xylanase [Rhizobium leguminosarum]|uniref:endo-1,4-beta-xylanase n=1 Tax=Rhizobium leguminosarum TaxID=384 RepID=UPI001FD8B2A2|nr:endo-1,4-beta-xylanase [Rhizobium leguminosarum]